MRGVLSCRSQVILWRLEIGEIAPGGVWISASGLIAVRAGGGRDRLVRVPLWMLAMGSRIDLPLPGRRCDGVRAGAESGPVRISAIR
jgi:hypothetical protein